MQILVQVIRQGWSLEMFSKLKLLIRQPKTANQEKGWLLVSAMVMIILLTAVGLAISQLVAIQYQDTNMEEYTQNAQLTAEAGVEQTVDELNSNSSFTGYSTPQQFFDNSVQGIGDFTTSITTNANGTSKTIVSIADVYRTAADSTPSATNSIKVTIVDTGSSGYSVMTGPGGLILSGSANVVNSNVYVGGTITMSGAAKIGTYSKPVNVDVGNDACPTGSDPGSSYPEVCTNGTQPINLAQSTNIYGSVCATDQTSTGPNNNIQGGNGGQGLESGCTAPIASPPTYNRMAQIDNVTTTASGTDNTYVCDDYPFDRTWPANLELTGNVSIGGSCNVTISGDVYVTGNLTIGGASTITVANSVGSTDAVVIVDGTITVDGSASMITNSSGAGIDFISFDSADSCTTSTTDYCSTISGNALQESQTMPNVTVGGSVSVPGMIFDAYWSEVTIQGSGNVGAATGQTVNLNGSGSVIFGTQLASSIGTWSITSYEPYYQ